MTNRVFNKMLEKKPELFVKNKAGLSPADIINQRGNEAMKEIVKEASPTPLFLRACRNSLTAAEGHAKLKPQSSKGKE